MLPTSESLKERSPSKIIMSPIIISHFPKNNNNMYNERRGPQYFVPVLAFTGACLIAFLVFEWRIIAETADFLEAVPEIVGEPIQEIPVEEATETEPAPEKPIKPYYMTDDDIIAAVVMGEAGNQDLLGKTAVAATVLNRADYFGLTVEEVVSAEGAYNAWPYYGLISSDCYRAVEIARENRDLFPETMMYFKTKSYHSFGEPYEQIGDHFFSYLKEGEAND